MPRRLFAWRRGDISCALAACLIVTSLGVDQTTNSPLHEEELAPRSHQHVLFYHAR